jgi:arylsulfatase A-like enzyme
LSIREQHWFGSITAMDEQIGRVRDELARRGIAGNTLVHFCSDNGPSWVHELGSAGPYRGQKGDLYEGGIHVPAIIEWPSRLKGGRVVKTPISTDDLLPTIAAAAGAALPQKRPLDGENTLPILEGKTSRRTQPLFFHSLLRNSAASWEASAATQSSVIDGRWKLITVDGQGTFQLFDLSQDPAEQIDLAAKEPRRVARMKFMLEQRLTSFRASAQGANYRK